MAHYVFAVLVLAVAFYAQDTTTTTMHLPETREMVNINGTQYFFGNDFAGGTWDIANVTCTNMSMAVAGFETDQEWSDVTNWMKLNGKMNWYWTSGHNVGGTTNFEWGSSGVNFTTTDKRWENGEPMGGNPNFVNEHVSMSAELGKISSDSNSILMKIICEIAK